jgi:hypothetical protein
MDHGPGIKEDEFNEWYTKEHVAERLGIKGVLSGARYDSLQGIPRYIALYELNSIEVLSSDEYMAVRRAVTPWTRRIGRNLVHNLRREFALIQEVGAAPAEPSPYLLLARYKLHGDASPKSEAADLASVAGVTRVRHYRGPEGDPPFLSIFEIANPEVAAGESWKRLIAGDVSPDDLQVNVAVPIDMG